MDAITMPSNEGEPPRGRPMRFPNRIRELREAKGLTQFELGQLTGTGNQQISRLEVGARRLSVDWMQRIAAALEVEPWELLTATRDASTQEFRALQLFRDLDHDRREHVLKMLELLGGGSSRNGR